MRLPLLAAGVALGALLALGPLWGLAGTVLGMTRSFDEISRAQSEVDPSELADGISVALTSTVLGIAVCPLGVVLLVLCIAGLARDARREEGEEERSAEPSGGRDRPG